MAALGATLAWSGLRREGWPRLAEAVLEGELARCWLRRPEEVREAEAAGAEAGAAGKLGRSWAPLEGSMMAHTAFSTCKLAVTEVGPCAESLHGLRLAD